MFYIVTMNKLQEHEFVMFNLQESIHFVARYRKRTLKSFAASLLTEEIFLTKYEPY